MFMLTRTDSDKCEFIGQENWPYFYFTSKFYVHNEYFHNTLIANFKWQVIMGCELLLVGAKK